MSEEAVAQSFTAVGALHQARDVDELDDRGDLSGRLHQIVYAVEPWIGNLDHAYVRIDRGERVGFSRYARGGERVEKRGFAGVGQSHYAGA